MRTSPPGTNPYLQQNSSTCSWRVRAKSRCFLLAADTDGQNESRRLLHWFFFPRTHERRWKMVESKTSSPIPRETALELCAEIRDQYRGKWWTLAGMQCIGCTRVSKGEVTKMCVSSAPGYRGCNLVNARYDQGAR